MKQVHTLLLESCKGGKPGAGVGHSTGNALSGQGTLPLNREGRAGVLRTGSADFPRQGKVMNRVMVHPESPVRRRRR